MIAFRVPESFDVLWIPSAWDCFRYQGWIYRRSSSPLKLFYREKWPL